MAASDLMTGWQLTILHWISDTFTPVSLPAPSLLPLQTWDGPTPFKHPKTGVALKGRELAALMDRQGFKLSHDIVSASIPLAIDSIIDIGTFALDLLDVEYRAHPLKSHRLKVLAHLIVTTENLLKVALTGMNPLLLNPRQIGATLNHVLGSH